MLQSQNCVLAQSLRHPGIAGLANDIIDVRRQNIQINRARQLSVV